MQFIHVLLDCFTQTRLDQDINLKKIGSKGVSGGVNDYKRNQAVELGRWEFEIPIGKYTK
jgi:hypothetical protein